MEILGIIDVIKAKRNQINLDDLNEASRELCQAIQEHAEDLMPGEDSSRFSHALIVCGWGGTSTCRNVLLQLLWGSSYRDEWIVLIGEEGLACIDNNGEFHAYAKDNTKKITANAVDGSMARIYLKRGRYLELRFDGHFAGQNPCALMKSVLGLG
jgi:hypothetical protein